MIASPPRLRCSAKRAFTLATDTDGQGGPVGVVRFGKVEEGGEATPKDGEDTDEGGEVRGEVVVAL